MTQNEKEEKKFDEVVLNLRAFYPECINEDKEENSVIECSQIQYAAAMTTKKNRNLEIDFM